MVRTSTAQGEPARDSSLCRRCVNTATARREGFATFQHVDFSPVEVVDCAGERHLFHFVTHLDADAVVLEAFELKDGQPGGYRFRMSNDDPEEEPLLLLARLIEKIRRGLSVKHLESGAHGLQFSGPEVAGEIAWDDQEEGRVPQVIIDGRPISWDTLGRMLMTWEGWRFRLEIVAPDQES
jgi:hypothetical protein